MKKIILSCSTVAIMALTFSGCGASYQEPTPEQKQLVEQMKAQLMARIKNGGLFGGRVAQAQEKPKVVIAQMTQEELKAKIEAFGVAQSPVLFEKTKSGFSINGKPHNDYEGAIKFANWDNTTGFVTYMIETSMDNYLMKVMQVTSSSEPLTVASVRFENGTWTVSSTTGKNLSGDTILMGSRGFSLTRVDGSGFIYDHANGIKSINVPVEYQVAKFQNGDILGTKTILLEIPEADEEENGGFSALLSSAKSLGSTLGINKKQDYAFLNIETGELVKINIPNNGKSKLQCLEYGERINKFVRKCLKYADPVESIYDSKDISGKNVAHYYWRVRWLNSPSGVIGITQEDSLGKIYATNLTTNKKVLIAEKFGGFTGFDVEIKSNGKINVKADKGILGTDIVEDVEAKINSLPAVVEEEPQV